MRIVFVYGGNVFIVGCILVGCLVDVDGVIVWMVVVRDLVDFNDFEMC